jgi:uncharacterized protein (DUF3820 family)
MQVMCGISTDYPFGIFDLRLLITLPIWCLWFMSSDYITHMVSLIYVFWLHYPLVSLIYVFWLHYPFGIFDLRLLITLPIWYLWFTSSDYITHLVSLISLCDKVCQWLATGQVLMFPPPIKTNCHEITEILLKVMLNTINQIYNVHIM